MKITDIKTNPDNPRIIKDDKFKRLVKSLSEFPEMMALRPIVVDADNMVLGGNMRLKALQHIGYKDIPEEWVKRASDLTPDQIRRFIITDNSSFGEWDYDALANTWSETELTDWGIDLPPDWGEKPEATEDDYQIPDEIETDIVLGDLFQIGQHRLLCGDSTDSEQVAKLMNGEKADMVFTDPPYGVSIGKKNVMLNSFQKAGMNLTDIVSDDLMPQDLKKILLLCFKNIYDFTKDCCALYVTAPQGGELGMMMMMMMEAKLSVKHVLIWVKNSPTFSMGRLDYDYKHEPILFTWKKTHKRIKKGRFQTSIWEIDKPRKNKEHPTMKPIPLIENALLNSTEVNDLVIDYFIGSGSTMVAAHQLNRKCYGMELDPKYCQVIIDRMQKLDPTLTITKNGTEL